MKKTEELRNKIDAIFDKNLTEVDNWNSAVFYSDKQKFINELLEAINYTRSSTQLPNIYEGTLNNDRIKIIRTLADNYNVSIDTIRSLFNDGADFYKQTLTK